MSVISDLFNKIPNIQNKRYLEIGVDSGWTFSNVKAKYKIGVDIVNPKKIPEVHMMSSDAFFEHELNNKQLDLIFIDGSHDAMQVCKDWNNSVFALDAGGVLVAHDMVPPRQDCCQYPNICNGTAYKLLVYIFANLKSMCPETNIYLCNEYEGICVCHGPGLIPGFNQDVADKINFGYLQTTLKFVIPKSKLMNYETMLENAERIFNGTF